jgi:hypothetical protein
MTYNQEVFPNGLESEEIQAHGGVDRVVGRVSKREMIASAET